MHIRYVPKKRIDFNLLTPDGRVALVYSTEDKSYRNQANYWKIALATALPAALLAPSLVPAATLLYVYPMLFLPSMYALKSSARARNLMEEMVEKMYLYQNGEQLLIKTMNGTLHKVEIIHND